MDMSIRIMYVRRRLTINALHHKNSNTLNMPMCTHLSKDIFDNQSSLGKAEPGRQNRMVKKISAAIGSSSLRCTIMISR